MYTILIKAFPYGEGLSQVAYKDDIVELNAVDTARAIAFGAIDPLTVPTPSLPEKVMRPIVGLMDPVTGELEDVIPV